MPRSALVSQMKKRENGPITPDGMKKVSFLTTLMKGSINNPVTTETNLMHEDYDPNNP
jgi:hypothetical protein